MYVVTVKTYSRKKYDPRHDDSTILDDIGTQYNNIDLCVDNSENTSIYYNPVQWLICVQY